MEPYFRIPANAPFFAWTCCTLLSWSWTVELSPPQAGLLNRAIFQDCRKCFTCGLNMLRTLQLMLGRRAVTTTFWPAPGENQAIFSDSSKGRICGLNLRAISQLILHHVAETTAKWCMAPCNNSVTIAAQNKSCCDLVPVFKPSLESLRPVNGSAKWQALKSGVLKPASQGLWSPLGGLPKWKALTATAGQSYSHLNHEVIEREFILKIATLPCAPTNLEPMPTTLRGIWG